MKRSTVEQVTSWKVEMFKNVNNMKVGQVEKWTSWKVEELEVEQLKS